MNALQSIQHRISVRNYSDRPVDKSLRNKLESFTAGLDTGPFGAAVRFSLLDLEPLDGSELRRLGTYGVIKGARLYILGAVKEGKGALLDLGYCMEKIILEATTLGLGTCWLGGTFRRSAFSAQMDLGEDELLPAITPIGYPAGEGSTIDRLFRFSAGSRKRKPWDELFYAADGRTPLQEQESGLYRDALEAVRMGPSASNRQPWRIIRDDNGAWHLCLKEDRLYNRILGKIRLQYIDLGIALCHFELVAREQGLPGRWDTGGRAVKYPGLKYIAAWTPY